MQRSVSIGKYTLESLTAGMYSSPKDLYREYIQNSVDSIDQAIGACILDKNSANITISIDKKNRYISIEDNGLGVPADQCLKRLTDIGNSNKIYSTSRGFRGIGRLAGLSYCEKLSFITSYEGESKKSTLVFDCSRLKQLLIPGQFSEYDLSSVLSEVINYKVAPESSNKHYFKVVLEGVEDIDNILNIEEMKDYLCQVTPLPFNDDTFKWGKEIRDRFKIKGINIGEYNIFIGHENKREKLFKFYTDSFLTDKIKKITDEIKNVEITEIYDEKGNVQAILWYSISNFFGTILDESKKGIRFRKGNILIGDKSTLNSIFKEDRFNGWFQGEIYIIDENLIPNARRDNFEKNSAYIHLTSELSSIGDKLSKIIRNLSNARNDKNSKVLNDAEVLIDRAGKFLKAGFNSQKEKDGLANELLKHKSELEKTNIKDELNINRKVDIFKQLNILANNVKGATNFKILNLSQKLTIEQKKILEKVFEVISDECSKEDSDHLISKIMEKF